MVFQLFKRLVVEDFDQANQTLIGKIATIYNPLVDQLNSGLKNNLDFSNLNQQLVTFTVTVDSTGVPTDVIQLTSKLNTSVRGTEVINAINNTDNTKLTGAPYMAFTRNNSTISIEQITGIVPGKKYSITAILYG